MTRGPVRMAHLLERSQTISDDPRRREWILHRANDRSKFAGEPSERLRSPDDLASDISEAAAINVVEDAAAVPDRAERAPRGQRDGAGAWVHLLADTRCVGQPARQIVQRRLAIDCAEEIRFVRNARVRPHPWGIFGSSSFQVRLGASHRTASVADDGEGGPIDRPTADANTR